MSNDEILNQLIDMEDKEQLTPEDIKKIISYANNDDTEIRSLAAQLLVMANSNSAKKTLIELASDNDCLVRVNACDSLGAFIDNDVLKLLEERSKNDDNALVRAYAVLSIGDILCSDIIIQDKQGFMNELLLKEKSLRVQTAIYKVLYQLGNAEYLDYIIGNLSAKDYTIRCFALNILKEIKNRNNADKIIKKIEKIKENETSTAVISKIDEILYNTSY